MAVAAIPLPGTQVVDLPLDVFHDSPFQLKRYDDARVHDLAETIRKQGLLQPATVRRVGDGYELIAGHGRAAVRYLRNKVVTTDAEQALYTTLRCVLLEDVNDAPAAALPAIEYLQRDDGTELKRPLWSPGPAAPGPTGALLRRQNGRQTTGRGKKPLSTRARRLHSESWLNLLRAQQPCDQGTHESTRAGSHCLAPAHRGLRGTSVCSPRCSRSLRVSRPPSRARRCRR